MPKQMLKPILNLTTAMEDSMDMEDHMPLLIPTATFILLALSAMEDTLMDMEDVPLPMEDTPLVMEDTFLENVMLKLLLKLRLTPDMVTTHPIVLMVVTFVGDIMVVLMGSDIIMAEDTDMDQDILISVDTIMEDTIIKELFLFSHKEHHLEEVFKKKLIL
uniref:Uncharacterized protein n=1 Tax=Lepeophtheirus salmonis TaxID=72036 RepID=A0A0K2V0I7_LEPSM